MPLREDVLQPIQGDNPSGPNLYYSPLFDKIKEARRQESSGPMGAWEHEVKTADYVQVCKLSEEALAKQTKDLWLGVWLTEALIWREQFAGLKSGLDLIRALIENFWDTLHPDVEDGDAELRAAPLEWLGNYLEPDKGPSPALAVRFVPLNIKGQHFFQYKESLGVGYEESVKGNEQRKKARDEAIKEGRIPPEVLDAALKDTPKEWVRKLEADLKGALAALQVLDELCQTKFGNVAPSFTKLKRSLEELDGTVHVLLLKKLEQDPDPPPPPEFIAEAAAAADGDGTGAATAAVMAPERIGSLQINPEQLDTLIGAELHSRADAVLRVAAVARYLRQREPSSPVPYLLLRAFRWGELRDAVDAQLPQLMEAPPAEIRSALRRYAKASDWKQVLETAETAMSQGFGRGWLDIQRYAIKACDELGYKNASKALRAELKALLADVPDLPNQIMQDDTGAANPETIAWLRQEGYVPKG
jgi:type VI secretion system protein ImpA